MYKAMDVVYSVPMNNDQATIDNDFTVKSLDRHDREILTVGQLRKILADNAGLDDEVHVVIATDGWYDNVAAIAMPDPTQPLYENPGDYQCLTIFPGTSFDGRQF